MESEKSPLTFVKDILYIMEEFFSSKQEEIYLTILSLNHKYGKSNNIDR